MTQPWSPYPWDALARIPPALAQADRERARVLKTLLEPNRIAPALSELSETEVRVQVKSVSSPATEGLGATLSLALGVNATATLWFQPELAMDLLSRALRRPFRLSSASALAETLSGAFAALGVETARRAGCDAPRLSASDVPVAAVRSELTMWVAGKPYRVLAALSAPPAPARPARLATLGELPVRVPLVAALARAERAALSDFLPGNAWFPGAGWWLDPRKGGKIALAAASSDVGVLAELTASGDLVLRGQTVDLAPDSGASMTDADNTNQPLSQAVLDSPVVVRVELGAVSMTAREWSELAAGDVIACGRRIAEPVVLRVAGREVARGELVNLEGELGVRIRELVQT